MATLSQITYDIITAARPLLNDDDVIRETHVEYLINIQRALWIKNSVDNGDYVSENFIQELSCIPLEDIPAIECCDASIAPECTVKRSAVKLPKFADIKGKIAIGRISSPNKSEKITIQYVKRNRAPFVGMGRFNKNFIYAYILEGYLYLVGAKCVQNIKLKAITIQGVFVDPSAVSKVIDCDSKPCYDKFNDEYPLPDYMINYMKPQIINQLVQELQMPVDTDNDASHKINQ